MSREIQKYPQFDIHGRELILLSISNLSELFPLPARREKNFVLLLAMDGREETGDNLGNIPLELIKEGLLYLCSWGPDCERIHDIFDESLIQFESETGKENFLMTTWHEKESLDEVLWNLLYVAYPGDEFVNTCKTSYIVSVANSQWAEELRKGLSDIESLNNRVAG